MSTIGNLAALVSGISLLKARGRLSCICIEDVSVSVCRRYTPRGRLRLVSETHRSTAREFDVHCLPAVGGAVGVAVALAAFYASFGALATEHCPGIKLPGIGRKPEALAPTNPAP